MCHNAQPFSALDSAWEGRSWTWLEWAILFLVLACKSTSEKEAVYFKRAMSCTVVNRLKSFIHLTLTHKGKKTFIETIGQEENMSLVRKESNLMFFYSKLFYQVWLTQPSHVSRREGDQVNKQRDRREWKEKLRLKKQLLSLSCFRFNRNFLFIMKLPLSLSFELPLK